MELAIDGTIITKGKILKEYSRDKSPYIIHPQIGAIPKHEEDVITLVNYARAHHLPITPRAAGTNVCGSALGRGLVIDFSKMNAFLKQKGKRVWVEPGLIYNELNRRTRSKGFFLPYSPSSGDTCTIGGNVNTRASGLRGVKYGSIDRYVTGVRFVDSKSRVIDTRERLPKDLAEGLKKLQKKIKKDKKVATILKRTRSLKTSSGYNLQALMNARSVQDIATHLLVGSVGTLGLVTEIELTLARLPKKRITALAFFETLEHAGLAARQLLKLNPSALEIMDASQVTGVEAVPPHAKAVLLIETEQVSSRLNALLSLYAEDHVIETSTKKQQQLWDIRKSLLFHSVRNGRKAISFIEDVAVPVEQVVNFIHDLKKILNKHQVEALIYGHIGEGNIHIRPFIPKKGWKPLVQRLTREVFALVFQYKGTIAGEHGAGRNKSPYLKKEWGPAYPYFREVKKLFDPLGILNPNVMFTTDSLTKNMVY